MRALRMRLPTGHPVASPRAVIADSPRMREGAFTVVEVLIAALLATAVISGLALAVAGSGQLIGKAEVHTQMARASSSVFERLESNDGWISSCNVPANSNQGNCLLYDNPGGPNGTDGSGPLDLDQVANDDKLQAAWRLRVTGVAIDDAADGLRSDPRGDRDGRVPDRITITVTLAAPALAKARLGNPPEYVQSRTFDGRGRLASGSLIVEVCDVKNQVDDRMNIETCSVAGSASKMSPCPPNKCSVFPSVVNNPPSITSPNGSVIVRRWIPTLPIKITSGSESVTGTPLGDGSYIFKNVAAGSWNLQYPASLSNGHVVWAGHVRPAQGQVAVQPNTTSRAMVTYRPNRNGKVQAEFTRRVGFITWENEERTQDPLPGDYEWINSGWGCGYNGDTCPNELFRYWSEYREHNKVTIFVIAPHVDWQVWGGASDEVTLSTRPEAYGRAVNLSTNPPTEYLSKTTVGARRGYNTEHVETLDGIQAGLYTPININTESDMDVVSDPRSVTSGPVWVNADTGSVNGGNAQFELRGQGECYVAFGGVEFPEGATSYNENMSDKQLIMSAINQDYVEVDGFDGYRDDGCSMRKLRWNDKVYDCIVVCAYKGCWYKWTQYRGASSERETVNDPWGPDESYISDWHYEYDCMSYDPPLACKDWGALNCGPAPEIIYVPPVPIPCDGCGSTPPKASKFSGVNFGS